MVRLAQNLEILVVKICNSKGIYGSETGALTEGPLKQIKKSVGPSSSRRIRIQRFICKTITKEEI